MQEIFKIIFAHDNVDPVGAGAKTTGVYGSMFFVLISVVLTVLNVYKGYSVMACATGALIVGFTVSAAFAFRGHIGVSRVLTTILCGVVFSAFAITGGNQGFAILWILLVPLIGMMLVGLKAGFLLSLYFQVFLIVLFYTPLSSMVADYYTSTFTMRFPLLYFATFGAITFLMAQRQKLFNEVNHQANYDALTGVHNRLYYDFVRKRDDASPDPALTIISLDLNRLKYVNDNLGHEAGDEILAAMGNIVSEAFCDDLRFRTGGDEFSVISTRDDALESIKTFERLVSNWHGKLVESMTSSLGYASRADYPQASFAELARMADDAMYASKARFYKENNLDRRTTN